MKSSSMSIGQNLGLLAHIPGFMALLSAGVAWLWHETFAIGPLLLSALLALGLGQLLYRLGQRSGGEDLSLYSSMIVAALGWLVVPLLGALPILLMAQRLQNLGLDHECAAVFTQPVNAVFEAFSGFTSTGLTMVSHPSHLPHVMQWWRSFMQWVGGVGVIVLMLSILKPSISSLHLYESEARSEKIRSSVMATGRTIWWIYLLVSAGSVVALRGAGVPWWEALNHGMTGIATGGFTITDGSLGAYSKAARIVMMGVMIIGAMSFSLHYELWRGKRLTALLHSAQHRSLFVCLLLGGGIVAVEIWLRPGQAAFLDGLFQWVSALCTAGFQTTDVTTWTVPGLLILSFGMLLGGAAGSTAGGLKQERLVQLITCVRAQFAGITRTVHEVRRFDMGGKRITETELNRLGMGVATFTLLWLLVAAGSVFALLHLVPETFSPAEILFEVASALGNVGLTTGLTSPNLPFSAKMVLVLVMWVGRLEIFPMMALLAALVRRRTSR